MSVGQRTELLVERMGQAGDGVARMPDGRLAFVMGALPGERVAAEVTDERRNFVRARVVSVTAPSAERIEPRCPIFAECGGCSFQHWHYDSELRYKESRVRDALERIAHVDSRVVDAIRPAPSPFGYRNKGQFPVGGEPGHLVLGLYRRGTHALVPTEVCDIQDAGINQVLAGVQRVLNQYRVEPYDEMNEQGALRHVIIRWSSAESAALVLLVVRRNPPDLASVASEIMAQNPVVRGVGVNINRDKTNRILGPETRRIAGDAHITDTILGLTFHLSFTSFFQVNPQQVEVLYGEALNFLPAGAEEVWDLYSGVGTLASLAAKRARRVRALEANPAAVADAERNFTANALSNIQMDVGRVEDLIGRWVQAEQAPPEAVIVDPPRAGLDPQVVHQLLELKSPQIVYISCNPETWARDVAAFQAGYRLQHAVPVDMFPRTDHVEVASLLQLAPS